MIFPVTSAAFVWGGGVTSTY